MPASSQQDPLSSLTQCPKSTHRTLHARHLRQRAGTGRSDRLSEQQVYEIILFVARVVMPGASISRKCDRDRRMLQRAREDIQSMQDSTPLSLCYSSRRSLVEDLIGIVSMRRSLL